MESSEILLIVHIEDTIGEYPDSSGVGEKISKLPGPLHSIDESRRLAHYGVIGHHIGSYTRKQVQHKFSASSAQRRLCESTYH